MRDQAQAAQAAIAAAVGAARLAPSVHNTQPWRWRPGPRTLDLYADRGRALPVADPYARLLLMSCGAGLHHARIALAAAGWQVHMERLPTVDNPDHLARLTLTGHGPADLPAMRLYQTIPLRHTDRRPSADLPVPATAIDAVRRAVEECGIHLHTLRPEQVPSLASAVSRADALTVADAARRAETVPWVGGPDRATGIPDRVLPSTPPATEVPTRDFGHAGDLPTADRAGPGGHDRYARYGILFGNDDSDTGWLRAGEALSAAWLTAVAHDLTLLPVTGPIEQPGTRQALRGLLAGLGLPYAALRLGATDSNSRPPLATGRLDLDTITSQP